MSVIVSCLRHLAVAYGDSNERIPCVLDRDSSNRRHICARKAGSASAVLMLFLINENSETVSVVLYLTYHICNVGSSSAMLLS
jgi:hypothetical protein